MDQSKIDQFKGALFENGVNEHINGMPVDKNAIDAAVKNVSINEGNTSFADKFPDIDISPIEVCVPFPEGVKLDSLDASEPEVLQDPSAALAYYKAQPPLTSPYHGLFYDGEVSVLFGESNAGKTAFALHIIEYMAARTQRLVTMFDIETSDRSFYARCMVDKDHKFPRNFRRIVSSKRNQEAITAIANIANQVHPAIIVVDNMTTLQGEQEDAAPAKELILSMKDIAHGTGTTILLLAHTTKSCAGRIPLLKDVRGSGVIGDLADSVFCIAKSRQGEKTRVIKQVKSRNGMIITANDVVIVAQISTDDGMLKVVPEDENGNLTYEPESRHIMMTAAEGVKFDEKAARHDFIREQVEKGLTAKQISELEYNGRKLPYATVWREVERIKNEMPF